MKNKFSMAMSLAVILAMLLTSLALASEVNVAVVDVIVPLEAVTLAPGASGNITINLSVTGNQAGTATFEVYRNWTLSGGTFTGSNPQEFTVPPRAGGDPATIFSTTGTVTVAAGHASGGPFTVTIGVFDITNTNDTGAKLSAGQSDTYSVTVSAPAKTTPTITWANPADITYGTALSATQLNATASVAGTFTYTPAAGTILDASNGQTLHVDFVPNDTTLYNNASKDVMINVLRADPGCSISGYSGMYDGNAHGASGSCSGQGTLDLGASFTDVPGGTANWSFTGNSNYNNASGSVAINITQAPSQVSIICPANVTYTGLAIEPCSASVSGVGGLSQIVPVSYSNNINAGTATVSASYAGDTNHTGSSLSGSFTIDKAPTTTTVTCGAGPFTYSGLAQEPCSASVTGASGLNAVLAVAYSNNINAGTASASAFYAESTNHLASGDSKNFTIGQALLTVTADNKTVVFGQSLPTFTFQYSGFVNGETASVLDTAPSCGVGSIPTHGNYPITCSGGSDNNYAFAYVNGTLNVQAWTLNGFYQPVDMNNVVNTVKGGSTVPLKFEVFAGSTELTATSVVKSFVQTRISCDTSASIDEIEVTSTGGTSLRYDTTAGQFIQNWQTPRQAGACYRVTLTTQDNSSLVALFRLK